MVNYNGEKFLDVIYKDLYNSKEVNKAKKNIDKRYESIKRYLDLLERAHIKYKETLKNYYYEKYIIKEDVLKKRMYSDEDIRKIINLQKKSLDRLIDCLLNEKNNYPTWIKYWAFHGMIKMGTYDEGLENYLTRSKDTEAPFIDINPQILLKTMDTIEKYVNKNEISDEEFTKIIKSGSFSKIYTAFEKKYINNITKNSNTEGIWKKYNQGNEEEALKLYDSLQGKNTHWCTACESDALRQVCGPYEDASEGGDFYVYYTKDKEGNYTFPRIAIRMKNNDEIKEIRGILDGQNMEDIMIPILEKKLNEMTFLSDKEIYLIKVKISDLKELTKIYKKTIKKEELTNEEIINLYSKKYGFGYTQEPKFKKILSKRKIIDDFYKIDNINTKINMIYNHYISYEEISNDKEFLLEFMKKDITTVLHFCSSKELKDDKEYMMQAVKISGIALEYASEKIKQDKEVVLESVKKDGKSLKYVHKTLQDDKEVVLEAIKQDKFALKYASNRLKKDKEILDKIKNDNIQDDLPFKLTLSKN